MSDLLSAIHETAKGLHNAGVMKKETLREFDILCLPKPETYTPEKIKEIRNRYNVSQAVFAAYLNISASTIQKWEQGQKKPNGVSLKLLSIVDKKGLDILL